ncbi:hypothetical protein SCHPADRAFT_530003 [Schizopora paradoxa]|uniref:Uncharacterized protein n=1 Tax=Schizopora paradoxa TaxID=27342 RepID=A0A0H2RZI9_9AGAM|nr:hypothetical protein SCHPADRAFT_530003 [Schizopora paradoxa]
MSLSIETASRTIVSALNNLSDETLTNGPFPWSFGQPARGCLTDDAEYDALRSNLRVAESVEELLRQMLASASAIVANLKTKFNDVANQHKFHTLPDEILSIVFEMTYRSLSSGHVKMVNELSLVSRRFRNVILGLPVLWSEIAFPYFRIETAELFACRAKSHPLAISLDDAFCWESKGPEFVRVTMGMYALTASLSSRIQKLSVCFSDFSAFNLNFDATKNIFANASFPCLSDLTLKCLTESTRAYRSLCQDWNMPSLTTLRVVNVLPIIPPVILSKILTLSVDANRDSNDGDDDAWRPTEIITFLLSCLSVANLRVAACLFNTHPSRPLPKMESVKRLTVDLHNTGPIAESNILSLVEFRSLTSFRLHLGISDLEDLDEALERIEFLAAPTSVTEVTLTVGVEVGSDAGRAPLRAIEEWCNARFKGLKSLTLGSNRRICRGLFEFTRSIDVLKVIDRNDGEEGMSDRFLSKLMPLWDHPHRTAVIGAEENDDGIDGSGKIRFIDSFSDCESESD